jgi:acetolactate synthase-1/2/3 large subunit
MAVISGGELLAKCLKEYGVKRIFAIPDGTYNIMFKWMRDEGARAGMTFITPGHEAAGAHMADGWYRVTGQPTVVMAGAGPGVANLISGVITAHAEDIPMLVITTHRRSEVIDPPRGAMQVFDQRGIFQPVTKLSSTIHHWKRIPELVSLSLRTAVSGIPGPVLLNIPEDIMNERREESEISGPLAEPLPASPGGDPAAVEAAARLLVKARTPFIHAGTSVVRCGAEGELMDLAEYLGVPVTMTPGGRGAVPEDHPQAFPTLCIPARVALAQSDLVLALGVRFGELDFWGKAPLWGTAAQEVIQVHIAPERIGANRPVRQAVVGNLKPVLRQLLGAVRSITPKRALQERIAQLKALERAWWGDLNKRFASDVHPMLTGRLIKEVREYFPRETIMVLDGGNTTLWAVHFNLIYEPRTFLWTSDFGHLGTGLPYAMGAKLAFPDRPVCLISGDSAFAFNLQELETARRHEIKIVAIVNVDSAWGMERASQKRIFGDERYMNCEHVPIRYDELARVMGCHGEFVSHPQEIRPALDRCVASGLPAVIHAEVDAQANINPPGMELWVGSHAAH